MRDQYAEAGGNQLEAVGKAFDALLLTVYRLTHRQNELLLHMDNVIVGSKFITGSEIIHLGCKWPVEALKLQRHERWKVFLFSISHAFEV
jgi:hypothetical protein